MSANDTAYKLRANLQIEHARTMTAVLCGSGEQREEIARLSMNMKYSIFQADTRQQILDILDERLVDCVIIVTEASQIESAVVMIDTIRSANAGFSDVPIIATASVADSKLKSACLLAGCTAFVPALAAAQRLKRVLNKVRALDGRY